MKINVSKKDIHYASVFDAKSAIHCAIHRALWRKYQTDQPRPTMVYGDSVEIGTAIIPLPKRVRDWIANYDLKPFTFTLDMSLFESRGLVKER